MIFEEFTDSRGSTPFQVGDPVIITGAVEYQGKTGDVREIGRDGAFVVVNLYNYGPYSFHASDVGYNDYADSQDELAEGVNDPHTFKCIFLFGPMGAGKSTVARPLLSHTGLRSVNLDNFNEMFIKKGQVPTGHLSPDQLEKSWQLSQTQQQNFIDGRLGIIIDGSGRNPNTAISIIEKLQPLGYEFMMIFVNVSEATSVARQQSRADKQQQQWGVGRQVDTTLAKNTYNQVQNNLKKYQAYFGPERFVYVDNENTPNLNQATKKVDAFLRAPVTQPAAIEWIQSQKGGQPVAQQQQKLATAQNRQQQAAKQYNPLNPKFLNPRLAKLSKERVPEGDKIGNMDADKFDDAMARLRRLAGAGPLKTVYDPAKRVYRNVPTAVQPPTQPKK
jgi:adenylate kinase family enzyme